MTDTLHDLIARIAGATIRLMRDEYENVTPAIHRWDWQPGVGLYGLLRAYEVLGDPAYLDYSRHYVDRLLDADIVSYSINGSILFETVLKLYEHTRDERYRDELRYFLRWLLRSAARCQNGCLEHTWTNTNVSLAEQAWVDTLFMAGIVLAESYRVFGRDDCRDEAVLQFEAHRACLQDPDTGLYRHLYDGVSDSHMAGVFWGRGNGWMAASSVDVLEAIGQPGMPEGLVTAFQRQMAAVRPLQDASGMFHTVLDDPDTYLEMSATAGLGYAALKGIRLGLLAPDFAGLGEQTVQATVQQTGSDGIVGRVSSGTSGFIAYDDYNQIPCGPRLYGQALSILLLAERVGFSASNQEL